MSYSMDTVQMNTRIDRTLKREGDAALAAAGYTPSQAVRAIWELAVKLRKNPEKLRALLSGRPSTPGVQAPGNSLSEEATPANDDGLRAHRERMATIQKRFDDLGIDTSMPYADDSCCRIHTYTRSQPPTCSRTCRSLPLWSASPLRHMQPHGSTPAGGTTSHGPARRQP